MKNGKAARRGECVGNMHHDEREDGGSTAIAEAHSIAAADDEEALRQARAWRDEGRWDAWYWLVGRLVQAQKAGRKYESLRRLTDELSQVHDFCNDDGSGRVTIPHKRGLGRGLALLMLQECPQFRPLLRMREETRKETSDDLH